MHANKKNIKKFNNIILKVRNEFLLHFFPFLLNLEKKNIIKSNIISHILDFIEKYYIKHKNKKKINTQNNKKKILDSLILYLNLDMFNGN